jgi:hypothetical protein
MLMVIVPLPLEDCKRSQDQPLVNKETRQPALPNAPPFLVRHYATRTHQRELPLGMIQSSNFVTQGSVLKCKSRSMSISSWTAVMLDFVTPRSLLIPFKLNFVAVPAPSSGAMTLSHLMALFRKRLIYSSEERCRERSRTTMLLTHLATILFAFSTMHQQLSWLVRVPISSSKGLRVIQMITLP